MVARGIDVPPFIAMEVAREAGARNAAGAGIVRLDVGQPHFGAPARALEFARKAMAAEPLGYSDGIGRPDLRAAIAALYARRYGVTIGKEQVAVTTGVSGALSLAFLALFPRGGRIALASPSYPPYRHVLSALGFECAILPGTPNESLQLTARSLAQAGQLDGALVASPANPTGAVLPESELAALCAAARARGVPLISDEIYHGLAYGARAQSALAFDPDVVVVNGFSKYWAMTGWRVGWVVGPEAFIARIERLAQNFTVAPPTISQVAALGALEVEAEAECQERLAIYAANRNLLLRALPELKLAPVVPPEGAFYALVDVSPFAKDSVAFCRRALDEARVALTPGVDFCDERGRSWARLAFCRPPADVEEGLARLAAWLPTLA